MAKPPCDEGAILAEASPEPASRAGVWVLVATILGSSMAFIDGTVVNVALPALQSGLNATTTDVQWVVESYALLLSAFLLLAGRLAISTAGGASLSRESSCSPSPPRGADSRPQSATYRGPQRARASAPRFLCREVSHSSVSLSEEERGRAIGTWSGLTAITTALGPVLGGWLVEHLSWRGVFFINLPIAFVVVVSHNLAPA